MGHRRRSPHEHGVMKALVVVLVRFLLNVCHTEGLGIMILGVSSLDV